MTDELQKVIDRYLDREDHEPDEIDQLFSEYTSQHASERMDRQRGSTRRRRATSLTTLSGDGAILAVQSTLSESERLVIGADGHALEILEDVEEDEEIEGEVVILRG